MFRKTFAFGGALLVAAALIVLTAGPSQAAPRGGGHAGFHVGGGFHASGFRAGGYHPAGGYGYGRYHAYYHDRDHYRGYGYYPYSLGYYPYSYGVYPYSYGAYPYYPYPSNYSYGSLPDYSSGLGSGSTGDLDHSRSYYPASPAQAYTTAPVADPSVPSGTPGQTPMTKVQ